MSMQGIYTILFCCSYKALYMIALAILIRSCKYMLEYLSASEHMYNTVSRIPSNLTWPIGLMLVVIFRCFIHHEYWERTYVQTCILEALTSSWSFFASIYNFIKLFLGVLRFWSQQYVDSLMPTNIYIFHDNGGYSWSMCNYISLICKMFYK